MSEYKFKTINYSRMIIETLRELSVNKAGELSYIYKMCLGALYVFQPDFDSFHLWRVNKRYIANCKWQIGQLTNTLNFLFDNDQKRIYISQATYNLIYTPDFESGETPLFVPDFDANDEITVFAPDIDTVYNILALVTFHIPSTLYNNATILEQITSTIEQIRIDGINYQIVSI